MTATRSVFGLAALGVLLAGAAAVWVLRSPGEGRVPSAASDTLVVYRSEGCDCCGAWAEYMRTAGFRVQVERREEPVRLKRKLGVPPSLFSCHTAVLGGVIVEGHVPASTLRRFLSADAPAAGLSVPGMQAGSPGMASARPASFSVFSFDGKGRPEVFERWRP
jgi:hypothetical protein